jgi:hypothetical protein
VVTPKPGEFTNLTLSEQQPRTVTVIALDTVNTPFLDQSTGRRELVKYLASSLDSGQVLALMIITSHGLKIIQGLTGDSVQLMRVLKKASGEFSALNGVDIDAQADAAAGDVPEVPSVAPGSDPGPAIDTFLERGDAIYAQFQQQKRDRNHDECFPRNRLVAVWRSRSQIFDLGDRRISFHNLFLGCCSRWISFQPL